MLGEIDIDGPGGGIKLLGKCEDGDEKILCLVTEDGSLIGATDSYGGYDKIFWEYLNLGEELEVLKVKVPEEVATKAKVQGISSDQVYNDGYEAWSDILDNTDLEPKPIPLN